MCIRKSVLDRSQTVCAAALAFAFGAGAYAGPVGVVNTQNSGAGSLRNAIAIANSVPGPNDIVFNIPGGGPHTITITAPLPDITDTVVIDGSTQPGFAGTPLIRVDGPGGATGDGLVIQAPDCVIRSLSITRFAANGIRIAGSAARLEACYIGLDHSGDSIGTGNAANGVLIDSATSAFIGTNSDGVDDNMERNVISGNGGAGVLIQGSAARLNAIAGNLIGVNASGQAARGNTGAGVAFATGARDNRLGTNGDGVNDGTERKNVISGNGVGVSLGSMTLRNKIAGNLIGTDVTGQIGLGNVGHGVYALESNTNIIGTDSTADAFNFAEQNVISSNNGDGVRIENVTFFPTLGSVVAGNLIGVAIDGHTPLANVGNGVTIIGAATMSSHRVGSNGDGIRDDIEANTIAFNVFGGVVLPPTANPGIGVGILTNSIYSNGQLGIDLLGNGVTPNDGAPDSDPGPNDLQNFPVILGVTPDGLVSASLASRPSSGFRVEFFQSAAPDASGFGEGFRFVGAVNAMTDGTGIVNFSFPLDLQMNQTLRWLTATATLIDLGPQLGTGGFFGRTSEFSQAVFLNGPPVANSQTVTTLEDTDVTITLTGSDPNGDPLTFFISSLPGRGQLRQFNGTPIGSVPTTVTDAGRRVIFRPVANESGTPYTTFGFRVNDTFEDSAEGIVTVNVTEVNDNPTANPQTVTTFEDVTATITLTGTDPDGGALTARIVSLPSLGQLRQFGTNTPILSVPTDVTDPNRRVLFVPGANENGSPYTTFAFVVRNAGGLLSPPATVTVNVTPVNDAPDFQVPAQTQSLEDAGALTVSNFATGITAGPPDESGQALTFHILSNSNAALFSAQPNIALNGTLTYTAAPNAFGSATIEVNLTDNGGTANGGIDTSVTRSFIINVLPVNDAPDFAITAAHNSLEDAGPQSAAAFAFNITVGPANESGQTAAFQIVSNTNAALFSAAPAISPTGTLTYTAASNAFGTATIGVRLQDNGGTANGGIDTSGTRTFVINVGPVNDPPNFDITAAHNSLEDAGPQTAPNFAFNITPGPANESGQVVTFTILSNSNPSLFSAAPAIAPNGTLTYTATPNAIGSATLQVQARDNGGTANGGNDTGPTRSFAINVGPVNDPPTFSIQPQHSSVEDAPAQSVPNFAFNISPGPPDESGQTVQFLIISNSNGSLFIAQPQLSPAGTLTYTAAANQFGTATIQVRLMDNGGTANGGQDTSPVQSFQIQVRPVNDPPSFTAVNPPAVLENSGPHSGIQIVTSSSTGPANESGQTLSYLVSAITNPALFSSPPVVNGAGQLSYTSAANVFGTATFALRAQDNGGTADGGVDTSAPQTLTIQVRPQARCRDHIIDASSTCPDLMIQPGDVNVTPPDTTGGDPEYFVSNLGPFALGPPTPVLVTVVYRVDGLTSTCTAFVTVLGSDCNGNGVPDTCDIAGGEPDCDGNMVPDFCECFWNNGTAPTSGLGQLSHIGGGAGLGARVADDFVLDPGFMHHVTRFAGTMYTNSQPYFRHAKIQFFYECNGVPDTAPFVEFTNSVIAEPASPPGPNGLTRVHYVFDLCDAELWLEGGKTYWVSLIGLSDGATEDVSFWAATSTAPIPHELIASVPRKAEATGQHTFGPWEPLDECCIGCVNMAYDLKGASCPLIWDNGPPDLAATAGGSPSGAAGLARAARTADNFVTKSCSDETVCYIDAFIWTNCAPPVGFLELYENFCDEPGENPIPMRTATPTRIIPTGEQVTINGVLYDGYQLRFTDLGWLLRSGRTYWLSAGASGTGDITPRGFFAYRDECPECPIRITPGATRNLVPIRTEWEPTTHDYSFRVAVMADAFGIRGQGSSLPPPACAADIDRSGAATVQDLFDFLSAWFAGCP